jgi:hypothetical protein
MINIVRKEKTADKQDIISTKSILAVDTDTKGGILLTDPVKDLVEITYDATGHPDQKSVVFGVQYDHRVTWIRFNLSALV